MQRSTGRRGTAFGSSKKRREFEKSGFHSTALHICKATSKGGGGGFR